MDASEIERALRGRIGSLIYYKGIYTSDNLPFIEHSSKPVIFIANTLESTVDISIVGHWVCFYIEFEPKKRIVFYDSFGLKPCIYSSYFSEYIEEKYPGFPIYDFGLQLQPDNSQKCGLYVIHFIHYVSIKGLDKFTSYAKTIFSSQKLFHNDKYVTRYYLKYLSKLNSCSYWKIGRKRAITYKECKRIIGEFFFFFSMVNIM